MDLLDHAIDIYGFENFDKSRMYKNVDLTS